MQEKPEIIFEYTASTHTDLEWINDVVRVVKKIHTTDAIIAQAHLLAMRYAMKKCLRQAIKNKSAIYVKPEKRTK